MTATAPTPRERPILFSGPMVRAILDGRKTQTRRIAEPLRVVPRGDVHSDMPSAIFGLTGDAGRADDEAIRSVAIGGGRRYPAGIGGRGAVFAELHHGEGRLGLKPGEFDFVCPHADGRTYLDGGWRIDVAPEQRLWVREAWRTGATLDGVKPADLPKAVGILDVPIRYLADDHERDGHRIDNFGSAWGRYRHGRFMPRWASRLLLEVTEVRVQRLTDITEDDASAEGVAPFFEQYPSVGRDQQLTTGELASEAPFRASFAVLWDSINGERADWVSNPWVFALTFRRVP